MNKTATYHILAIILISCFSTACQKSDIHGSKAPHLPGGANNTAGNGNSGGSTPTTPSPGPGSGSGDGNGTMDLTTRESDLPAGQAETEQNRRIEFNNDITLFDEANDVDAEVLTTRLSHQGNADLKDLDTSDNLPDPDPQIYFAKNAMSSSDAKQTQDHVLLYASTTDKVFRLKFRIISAVHENYENFKQQLIQNVFKKTNNPFGTAGSFIAGFLQMLGSSNEKEEFVQISYLKKSSESLAEKIETTSICRPLEEDLTLNSTNSNSHSSTQTASPGEHLQSQCAVENIKVQSAARFSTDGTLLIKLDSVDYPGLTYILKIPLQNKSIRISLPSETTP